MQTTADLIRAFVKLAASVQNGHYYLQGRLVQLLVLINRDASTVVLYGNALVFVDGYFNMCTVTCHGLVDRVVDGFVHQVVKAFFADVANVHGGALANGF